jgi:predicted metal-dependent hydrolase
MSDVVAGTLPPLSGQTRTARVGAVSITPRNIRFMKTMPEAATWLGGDVVATAVFNALSLTFPDGERMFMDSVRHYKNLLDGDLLEEANAFIAQEAIHTREHVSLNKCMDGGHYPLEAIRADIRKNIDRAARMGPMTQLAATISLEHFTALLGNSILSDKTGMLDGAPEEMRRMWQWHALEETEHKAVAFDVFDVATAKLSGLHRYSIRLRAMLFTTLDFTSHIVKYAAMLLQADGMSRGRATAKVLWFIFGKPGFFRIGLHGYWDWYKPGFHPWHHDNRALLETWRAEFPTSPAAV